MSKAHLEEEITKQSYELEDVGVFGRALDCTIRLEDAYASRRHAMIRKQPNSYWFYDLGSINGSYINGKRVVTATKLCQGDHIKISDTSFLFHAGDAVEETFTGGMEKTVARVQTVPVVMLVSDVKGFSRISEKLPPDELAQVIGGWYKECNAMLPARGAGIDKFIGDAVLAYWLSTDRDTKVQALCAARDMIGICAKIQQQHHEVFEKHGVNLAAGVALNQGLVAHGGMDAGAFTLLGEAVNITFRLEGLTRVLDADVVVGEEFLKDWEEGRRYTRSAGSHEIKGHSNPVEVHLVHSFPEG